MSEKRTYAIEDFFGALLLIGGLSLLGLFSFQSDEPLVEAGLRAQSSSIVQSSVHGLKVDVEGRHLRLSGLADTETEKTRILDALRALEGRGRIETEVTVLEPATPFVLTAERSADAVIRFGGAVASEAIRETWRDEFGDAVDTLTLASGMPDDSWPDVALAGMRALGQMHTGTLTLSDSQISLAGTALTPEQMDRAVLLLENTPEPFVFTANIDALDDGTPLRFSIGRRDGALLGAIGKLPNGLELPLPDGEITRSVLDAPLPDWGAAISLGLDALNQLYSGHLSVIGTSLTLSGEARSQQAQDKVQALLQTLPAGISVSDNITLTDDGAPFALILDKTITGIAASGKVPLSLSPRVLAALSQTRIEADALLIATISPGQDWWQAASIGAEALRYTERGRVTMRDQTLTLDVTVQDPVQETALRDALGAVPDSVTVALNLTLIDDGTPLRMTLAYDGASAVVRGKLPDTLREDQLAQALGAPVLATNLQRTPKPGPDGWAETAQALSAVLGVFEEATLKLNDTQITLTGTLRTPALEPDVMAMLEDLPAAYSATTQFSFRDDGRPFAFRLVYDGQNGVLSGKVPMDLGPSSQQAILGFAVQGEALDFAEIPADAQWWAAARSALKALSQLENGTLQMDAYQITLTGQAADDAAVQSATARLEGLPEAFRITVQINLK
ncbi:MAG: BON domain-containing protein [Roseovarius sp.]